LQTDYGSTILSESAHRFSVAKALKLDHAMGSLLRNELSSDNIDALERLSQEFAPFAIGLKKIWSFFEGQDTKLRISPDGSDRPLLNDDAEPDVMREMTILESPVRSPI
jgi:hypothetical protein